jgi:NitT/TauT family transport system ATP-binding protein
MLEVAIARKHITSAAGERLDVLTDLAFTLAEGEVGVLVGPSGCGKTTLLRIIAGLDRDFAGRIALPPKSRIGMVFQEPRLLPWRSVDDNVRLAAPDADEATLAALFATLELTTHRSHFPGELSLGLARRVALARAVAINPDVLILDEPLVSLDAALAARLRDEIATLVDSRPVTTLLVTHDVDDAVRLADRIFLLSPRPGRIVAELPILTPRAARSPAEIASISAEIARLNGSAAPTERPKHKNSNDSFRPAIASAAKQFRNPP